MKFDNVKGYDPSRALVTSMCMCVHIETTMNIKNMGLDKCIIYIFLLQS